jgi:hypothetical protein
MKHDVKTEYNMKDKDIAEMLNAGYKLIGFSCGPYTDDHGETSYDGIYVFAKEKDESVGLSLI